MHLHRQTLPVLAAGLLSTLLGAGATAQTAAGDASRLEISVGMNRTTNSLFRGVLIQSRTDPLLDIKYERGRWFASLQNGAGYKVLDSDALTVGLAANYLPGRYASSDSRYRGMGDVPGTVSASGYFEWRPVKDAVTVYGNLARSTRASHGVAGTLGTTLGFPLAGKLSGFVDIYLNWGNAAYNQTFYGVNAAQAVGSGYATFAAPAGLVSTTPSVGLAYEVRPHWRVIGYAGQTRLSSGIAASPLVLQRNQPLAAVLLNWTY
jgi:outer membrane protein